MSKLYLNLPTSLVLHPHPLPHHHILQHHPLSVIIIISMAFIKQPFVSVPSIHHHHTHLHLLHPLSPLHLQNSKLLLL